MKNTLIKNTNIVTDGSITFGDVLIEGTKISEIGTNPEAPKTQK